MAVRQRVGDGVASGVASSSPAAENCVAIQAHAAGPIVLDVSRATPVLDALDGRMPGQGPRLSVPFKQGETRVLRF